ncbi:MerR family DNA-binding protein, partial [Gluconobacter kondonii]
MAVGQRLSFIRHARELGFSLDDIRELLTLSDEPDQSCAAVDEIAKRQLVEIEKRITRLTALKTEMRRMLDQCACQTVSTCRVIEVLGDHTLCTDDH